MLKTQKDLNEKSKNNFLKNSKKSMKGITLIALVITIIVLLILAGVSIATLTGENGILTRATDSKTQTTIAEEKEAIQLAYAGVVAEKRGTEDITAIDLNIEFNTNGINAIAAEKNQKIKITFDNKNRYILKDNGEIIGPISQTAMFLKDNASIYYGQDVVYSGYTSTYDGGWQLFYVDDETNEIFIISKNAVKNETLNKSGYSDYTTGGSVFVSTSKYGSKWNKMWLDKCSSVNLNNNSQGIAYLCDTTQWSDYAIQDTYAVGGPTLELLVASWNDSHDINNQIILNEDDVTSTGYPIPESLKNENSIPLNSLYRPTSTGMNWIASPSSNHGNHVCYLDFYGGYVGYSYYDDDRFCVRVLVSIPASKIQIKNETLTVSE